MEHALTDLDRVLLGAVPAAAGRVLVIGGDGGRLAAVLAHLDPRRDVVRGDLGRPSGGAIAGVPSGSFDAIVYAELAFTGADARDVLRRDRALLRPGGVCVAAVPNARHHTVFAALLSGEWPEAPGDGSPRTRAWTLAAAQRVFLDAGYAPDVAGRLADPAPTEFARALAPALEHLGVAGGRARFELDTVAFVLRGHPLEWDAPAAPEPMTFVACVSDERTLRANLLASPDLAPGCPHEVILVGNCPSAAAGLNVGLDRARHAVVVGVHQDVYLPAGWAARFARQWSTAEVMLGPLAVSGVYGINGRGDAARRVGHVVDRVRLLREPAALPAAVDSLDELLLAVRRDAPLRFDSALGFHLYGTDLCLQARRRGLTCAVLDAPCLHNSRGERLPAAFGHSVGVLAAKWAGELPVATPCVRIEPGGRYAEW